MMPCWSIKENRRPPWVRLAQESLSPKSCLCLKMKNRSQVVVSSFGESVRIDPAPGRQEGQAEEGRLPGICQNQAPVERTIPPSTKSG